MEQNETIKSLDELSPQTLTCEVNETPEANVPPFEPVMAETKSLKSIQPVFLTDVATRAYRGWRI